jgi:hypothetical protein
VLADRMTSTTRARLPMAVPYRLGEENRGQR